MSLDTALPNDAVSRRRLAALLSAARDFGQRGWTPATSGNYSVRLADGRIAVTRSGADKRLLEQEDLLLLDSKGQPPTGSRASAETPLHLQIYSARPAVQAVFHVHSPAVTVASRLAALDGQILLSNYELLKALDGIDSHRSSVRLPVTPNDQDMARLAAAIDPFLRSDEPCPAYLIEGHGIYAWGHEVADAARHIEALEFLLNCHLLERSPS